MRSFRQIKVARFTTAARPIAAFGSGYKGAATSITTRPSQAAPAATEKRQSPLHRALAFFFALDL
ncbi:hypothetical protein C4K24_1523 [Pseudomonas chlororaphis subsp. aurantiaca]|nr:hypothetical protein C4K24_1523 [Pseudomonas chlororaphis subsp. aurantiaca]